jgi:signal transduction histidine kinase
MGVAGGDAVVQLVARRLESVVRHSDTPRHQRLTMRFPPSPLNIQGDPVRLAQIFCNLLDSASKYTQDGGEIALVGKATSDTVSITVSDNGIGISQARSAKIFNLFGQEEHPLTIRGGGLGIGLAVVRDLVEAHGGAIVARSPGEHRGCEFIVTLPIRRESPGTSEYREC